jgi:hypothetical protein
MQQMGVRVSHSHDMNDNGIGHSIARKKSVVWFGLHRRWVFPFRNLTPVVRHVLWWRNESVACRKWSEGRRWCSCRSAQHFGNRRESGRCSVTTVTLEKLRVTRNVRRNRTLRCPWWKELSFYPDGNFETLATVGKIRRYAQWLCWGGEKTDSSLSKLLHLTL